MSDQVSDILTKAFGSKKTVVDQRSISGGCINKTLMVSTKDGNQYFLKLNDRCAPDMFEKEALGLKELKKPEIIFIPEVYGHGSYDGTNYLIMEFVTQAPQKPDFFSDYGIRLAQLHQNTGEHYGFDHDNYIGELPQSNKYHTD